MRNQALLAACTLALSACGNLTCDQEKKESINKLNAGVDLAKAHDYPGAEKELETATNLDPKSHRAWYTLGSVYADDARSKNDAATRATYYTKASDAFAQAAKFSGSEAMYHYKLGQALYESKLAGAEAAKRAVSTSELDEPRKELEAAVKINKRLYKAHWFLGQIAEMQERPHDAAVAWTESCHLNPGFGKAFVDLGELYIAWDDLEQAVAVLTAGAQSARDPEDRTNIYYDLGRAYDGQEKWTEAADAYKNAIDAAKVGNKENVEARYALGETLANVPARKAEAMQYLNEFLKMGGGDVNSPNHSSMIAAANDTLARLSQ